MSNREKNYYLILAILVVVSLVLFTAIVLINFCKKTKAGEEKAEEQGQNVKFTFFEFLGRIGID